MDYVLSNIRQKLVTIVCPKGILLFDLKINVAQAQKAPEAVKCCLTC